MWLMHDEKEQDVMLITGRGGKGLNLDWGSEKPAWGSYTQG